MSKPNNKRNNKPSYFRENVSRFGENFIETKSAYDLERDTKRIFRDLLYGNINFDVDGKYFYNVKVVEACLRSSYEEWYNANYNYTGNCLFMQQSGINETMFEKLIQYNMRRRDAYQIIWNAFQNFANTQDLRYLMILQNQLAKYKANI